MVSTFRILKQAGREVTRRWPVLLVFYLVNLAAAVVIIAPAVVLIQSMLGHSLESNRLFDSFDISWAAEAIREADTGGGLAMAAVAVLAGLIYMLISTFLAGGAIALYLDDDKSFFGSCARYLPRFLRLLLMSAPFYALVFAANSGLSKAISKLGEHSLEQYPFVMLGWGRVAFVLVLFWIVNVIFDYAKIILVAEERFGTLRAVIDSIHFLWLQPQALLIFLAVQVIGLALVLVYHGLSEVTPQSSLVMVLVLLALRQAYMLARLWTRLFGWCTAAAYYESVRGRLLKVDMPVMGPPEPPAGQDSFNSTIVAPVPPSFGDPG